MTDASVKTKESIRKREMVKARKQARRRRQSRLTLCLTAFLLVVLSVQTAHMYTRYRNYQQKEAALKAELKEEQERAQDLEDEEAYTKTDEYVENTARSKLGLLYDDEIIFKEKK